MNNHLEIKITELTESQKEINNRLVNIEKKLKGLLTMIIICTILLIIAITGGGIFAYKANKSLGKLKTTINTWEGHIDKVKKFTHFRFNK